MLCASEITQGQLSLNNPSALTMVNINTMYYLLAERSYYNQNATLRSKPSACLFAALN